MSSTRVRMGIAFNGKLGLFDEGALSSGEQTKAHDDERVHDGFSLGVKDKHGAEGTGRMGVSFSLAEPFRELGGSGLHNLAPVLALGDDAGQKPKLDDVTLDVAVPRAGNADALEFAGDCALNALPGAGRHP
jgi:hypothetical protein